ncbi:hypothetical protein IEO21_08722 [Rhodonia placenta]|uniref:FAD/NAD(P)-binding domain-containing protein n=1 Tax=Rhodonia placenta TaxID=104341 RepID=A0A8H7NVX6_9APHY|nr:hypothetical protein IEO21_08722 [Postia placenta]
MDTKSVAENWLTRFALSAFRGNVDATVQTFFPHGWLRDALVFTWNTRSLEGRDKISAYLHDTLPAAHLYNFKVDERKGFSTEPVLEGTGIGMGFTFEMPDRRGRGYAFLQEDMATADWKALSLFTMLDAIKGHEEVGPEPGVYGGHTLSWEEVDIARRKRIEEDPYVVIMGGGQTGLQVAARFRQMNIPTIVIEKNKAIGDQWRQRYPTLSLHTTRNHHTLLYQPYPQNWPEYTPRDKLANWLEYYAKSQDLIVWTSSYIMPTPKYDHDTKRWSIIVNKNGTHVPLKPAHLVVAIGMLGPPRIPEIEGRERYKGAVLHASEYMGGRPFVGMDTLVIGAANTSADVCQDLAFRGARSVTMVQRSSTCVVSINNVQVQMYRNYPDGAPLEICDIKFSAMPLNLQRKFSKAREKQYWEAETALHAKLRKGGLSLNMGRDGSGQHFLVYERAGGIDVGVADMIATGRVKVKSGVEIARFTEHGVVFTDGSELAADLVVFATGYIDPRVSLRELFGADVIDQTDPMWGMDEEGEVLGCYRPSGYPGVKL